ncbi:heat shock protein 30C-like [Hemicordylus capensis]|uniref:heat shock protein 30C-like n=1 Tax=Hemicordylus capensis TaxID=884348 RepID=UPI00230243C0|nr:heat shock protein 30C-like [Hemicordylus capensis]
MLCRLHLTAPRSPLRSRALWPRAGSLFDELEREMDAMWELLSSNWPAARNGVTATSRGTVPSTAPASAAGTFAVTQDMAGFDPRELVVKLVGEKVVLTGKKATQTPHGPFRYELFRREWDVPESVDREQLSCSISSEGQLRIEAPSLPSEPASRTVHIEVSGAENGAQAEPGSRPTESSRAKA